MKKYDAVFILDEHLVEDHGNLFAEELSNFLKSLGAEIETVKNMGHRQFTYEIKKRKAGIYWNLIFSLNPAKIADIKDKYRLDERIIRYRIFDYISPGKNTIVQDI